MSNPWFRLYSEIRNDPKLLIMPEALRWRYVTLLCLHNDGMYENTPNDEIALSLRVTVKEWEETRAEFVKRRLIDKDGKIIGWDKRQYLSDKKDPTAADRQKSYRDRKRNARNATVTSRLPEADTDTEAEKTTEQVTNPESNLTSPPSRDGGEVGVVDSKGYVAAFDEAGRAVYGEQVWGGHRPWPKQNDFTTNCKLEHLGSTPEEFRIFCEFGLRPMAEAGKTPPTSPAYFLQSFTNHVTGMAGASLARTETAEQRREREDVDAEMDAIRQRMKNPPAVGAFA